MSSLKQKIANRKANVAVIGLGYVGLPLAVNFAKAGYKVYGLDTDQDRVNKVSRSESYILDIPQRELAAVVKNKKFEARTRFDILSIVDCVIVCVPTPLKRKYTPDISFIVSALKTITQYIKKGTLVVLESTTYPGTTEELMLPVLEKEGLTLDKDFFLSFSPERIDPGNKNYDVTRIPKLVGGVSQQSGILTKMLYEKIIKNVHLVSSSKAAEMAKLLENSFRIINIGWINEVAMMCHKMNIDIWEVIDAAKTKPFGFMAFYPGLGVGGHCIPDDPLYLYWKAKHHGFSSKYIKLSADTNLAMPRYAVDRLKESFRKRKKNLKGRRVLVVGVTYKKDVKDLRKSPPLKLIHILEEEKCKVDYYDPIIPYLNIEGIRANSIELTSSNIKKYDAVLIATDHTHVKYDLIFKTAKFIFDIRNVYKNKSSPKINKL